jgi:putative endonuclease
MKSRTNFVMYYVYLIQSSVSGELYIGSTHNINKRLLEHNTNKSTSTKNRGPWLLVYCEAYKAKQDATLREHRLKYYGQALNELKKRISGSLELTRLVREVM